MITILVAEDIPLNSKIIDLNLRKHNYKTIIVENGREALNILQSEETVDLVISDIMMPQLDGLQLLEIVKTTPSLSHIPIVLCSAIDDPLKVRKAIELGCDHYFLKPINPGNLIKKIRELLHIEDPQWENMLF